MSEEKLKTTTIWLMISTALFFDALQVFLDFLLMGWLVTIFASLTFFVWFKMHGITFIKPKRLVGSIGVVIIDMIPIIGWLAWTVAISSFALSKKSKGLLSGQISQN